MFALIFGMSGAGIVPAGASTSPRYTMPLPRAQVALGFDPTSAAYGPGHRGADLRAAQGDPVLVAADGTVTFAGPVAGRGIVVVLHTDGIRTTYEPIDPSITAGAIVRQGEVIGVVAGEHGGRADVLHWGARRGEVYLNPLGLIRPLGVVRLSPRR